MDKNENYSGKAKGGIARANALTEEQRKEIAKKAAQTRWGLRATHKGNFKEEFGIDLDCFVLNDENKSAVITQRGMGVALGYSAGGNHFSRLINSKSLMPYLGPELVDKIENPILFQIVDVVPSGETNVKAYGYDVSILIDVCKALINASYDKKLKKSQNKIIHHAQIIINASAKSGIKGLVYALSGYKPEVEEVIAAFKKYILEEAKKYEKEFPTELYMEWQRLYKIVPPEKGKNWKMMHLTIDHIYIPLAKSNGRLLKLLREAKDIQGDKNKKLFQFLNEIGTQALRLQIGRVLGIAETSSNKLDYENKIQKKFGWQVQYSLFPNYPIET